MSRAIRSAAGTPRSGFSAVVALAATAAVSVSLLATTGASAGAPNDFLDRFPNATGIVQSIRTSTTVTADNAIFDTTLGTNGQACITCHEPSQGHALGVSFINTQFDATQGLDALFRINDTANSPFVDISTLDARRNAFSLFLNQGLVRITVNLPVTRDFDLVSITEPGPTAVARVFTESGPACQVPTSSLTQAGCRVSLLRRPLVNANMALDSAVNWDGRNTITDLKTQAQRTAAALLLAPADQFGPGLNIRDEQAQQIADYETKVFTAQIFDNEAGSLTAAGGNGGPDFLSQQRFRLNTLPALADSTMTLFDAWLDASGQGGGRAAVARGQQLFNSLPKSKDPNSTLPDAKAGCIECHNVRNVGNDTAEDFLRFGKVDENISGGVSLTPAALAEALKTDAAVADKFAQRVSALPVYCLQPRDAGLATVCVTDPARALVSGRAADAARFKPPTLRALASHAPFFHNGAAQTLDDVVDFYNETLSLGLTSGQHNDLVAFLRSL
jgi:mono/diheme cytochrome c family protein